MLKQNNQEVTGGFMPLIRGMMGGLVALYTFYRLGLFPFSH